MCRQLVPKSPKKIVAPAAVPCYQRCLSLKHRENRTGRRLRLNCAHKPDSNVQTKRKRVCRPTQLWEVESDWLIDRGHRRPVTGIALIETHQSHCLQCEFPTTCCDIPSCASEVTFTRPRGLTCSNETEDSCRSLKLPDRVIGLCQGVPYP